MGPKPFDLLPQRLYTASMVRKLESGQLATFDHDYVPDSLFDLIELKLRSHFPDREFRFLDVGGGQGFFADRILERFPHAQGIVLDNSPLLLSKNEANARKTLVCCSATELLNYVPKESVDVAFFNLSLHHFIGGTYGKTRTLQRSAIEQAVRTLAYGGLMIVTENLYDGASAIYDFPGFIIYALTSSRMLASIVRRLGANTAGCGVCFLSREAWRSEFGKLGLRETAFAENSFPLTSRSWKLRARLLTLKSISVATFILEPKE